MEAQALRNSPRQPIRSLCHLRCTPAQAGNAAGVRISGPGNGEAPILWIGDKFTHCYRIRQIFDRPGMSAQSLF